MTIMHVMYVEINKLLLIKVRFLCTHLSFTVHYNNKSPIIENKKRFHIALLRWTQSTM